jgi:adenylosuccinate synthase
MNGKVDVLLGLQWGDEGKGKVVDYLTPNYDIVARFQGGPNAGHTIEFNGKKSVLHIMPSGIFHDGIKNFIGNGVVIEPAILADEIRKLIPMVDPEEKLFISEKAHLIMPTHRMLDAAKESAKKKKVGTTGKGIGPTYTNKISREGLRIGDINLPFKEFYERYDNLKAQHIKIAKALGFDVEKFVINGLPIQDYELAWFYEIDKIRKCAILVDDYWINEQIHNGANVLAEGAQGTMLDIDFGTYPFVTSSNTTIGGVCTGLGVPASAIGQVFGIFKAYCTRVGEGPFHTELSGEIGEKLQNLGHEFGATTGRPRRCGWLDLVQLRYACIVNGVTDLMMMKADVMNDFEAIKVATAYRYNDCEIQKLPFAACTEKMEPIYTELPGWQQKIEQEIPKQLDDYIDFIEKYTGVPIKFVSYGPDRTQNLLR